MRFCCIGYQKNVQVQLMSFYHINIETIGKLKNYFFISKLKKCTSPANQFLSHECRNKNKNMIFFSNLKKCTRPANEFLLHRCRNNRKMKKKILSFKSEKNLQVQPMSFSYINAEKKKNEFLIKSEKKLLVQLMSFSYKGRAKKMYKFL